MRRALIAGWLVAAAAALASLAYGAGHRAGRAEGFELGRDAGAAERLNLLLRDGWRVQDAEGFEVEGFEVPEDVTAAG